MRQVEQNKDSKPPQKAEENAVAQPAGTGAPLPQAAQIQRMFGGHDLAGVNAAGPSASDQAFGAAAYTQGNDVHFGDAQGAAPAPMAHELAHVVQQSQDRVDPDKVPQ